MILSSRPLESETPIMYTPEMLVQAAQPAINLVVWLQSQLKFPNYSYLAAMTAQTTIEEALECLMLPDFSVSPTTGTTQALHFAIDIRPIEKSISYVSFIGRFRVVP